MFAIRLAAACAAALALALSSSAWARGGAYLDLYETLWSTVEREFYDPHFRGVDWAGARERHRAQAAAARTDAQFAAAAQALLDELGVSHLYLTAPGATGADAGAGVGARFESIDNAVLATHVAPLSDAARQGLRPGARLLSPLTRLQGPLGSAAALRVRDCQGRTQTLAVRRERVGFGERPGFRWTAIRTGPHARIGYIRIDRFDDGAAEAADAAMQSLANAKAIIIDIRENSGGNVSAMRLASYFGQGAEPGVVLMARPYLEMLNRPVTREIVRAAPRVDGAYTDAAVFAAVADNRGAAAFWTDAVDNPYRGRVFVLIGPETSSAAEGFAHYMRERTQAILLGAPTAGYLLSGDRFDLGDGWSVTAPVHGLWSGDGTDLADRAVAPHQAIAPTRADLCAGRDRVLEEAVRQANAE